MSNKDRYILITSIFEHVLVVLSCRLFGSVKGREGKGEEQFSEALARFIYVSV